MLQRGSKDPINQWRENRWCRPFKIEGRIFFVEIYEEAKNICIRSMNDEPIGSLATPLKSKVEKLLGFDDPLLSTDFALSEMALPAYDSVFEGVSQTIIGQLVSSSAANTIRCRFIQTFGEQAINKGESYYFYPQPEQIAQTEIATLAEVGLSNSKAR